MKLKPMPDLGNESENAKIGRLTRIANAHKDAVNHLRDGYTKINAALSDASIQEGIEQCLEALNRLDEINKLGQL